MKKNYAFDWDSVIEDDSDGFKLLEPGEYIGRISWYDKGRHKGSEKVPPCPKAIVHITLDTPDGPTDLTANLLIHKTMEWKIMEFFRAISQDSDDNPEINWDILEGAPVAVHVRNRSYTTSAGEERTVNDIDKFLPFNPSRFPEDPNWLKEDGTDDEEKNIWNESSE